MYAHDGVHQHDRDRPQEFIRQTAGKTTIEAVRLNLASLADRYDEMAARVERTDTAA